MNNEQDNYSIVEDIYSTMGGKEFIVISGSKNFVATEDSITFSIIPNKMGVTHVTIVYNRSTDEYSMDFLRYSIKRTYTENKMTITDKYKILKSITGLNNKNLKNTFYKEIGIEMI